MNRNLNAHYTNVPTIGVNRSVMEDFPRHMTTANASYIVPFHWQETIPGSTYSFDLNVNLRMSPAIHSTMDLAYCDTYWFFVPMRLIWDNFKYFIGEPENFWVPENQYFIPQISFPEGGFESGSLADHFGLPINVSNPANMDGSNTVSVLPFRAYGLVWNEYFRDPQTMDPVLVLTDDDDIDGVRLNSEYSDLERYLHGGEMLKASKPHDLFTSAQPSPQRGPDVTIPLGTDAPVTTVASPIMNAGDLSSYGVIWGTNTQGATFPSPSQVNGNIKTYYNGGTGEYGTSIDGNSFVQGATFNVQPLNLVAKLDNSTAATINDLRMAISIQHIYEQLALGGNRYREMLQHIWGVTDSNPNRDIPYYLGGNRFQITTESIVQTSATGSGSTPQGNVVGYTHKTSRSNAFTFSCLEHGIILGVFTIRQPKTYQQGINRQWLHRDRFDLFWPQFANLGSVAIENREIYFGNYAIGSGENTNTEAFGYNEAWYEYRYQPDVVTGSFRSNAPDTLASWHYADYYDKLPTLSPEFITDNSDINIDRTLAVTSSLSDQFLVDISIKRKQVLPMPVYSIPGLERI